MAVNQGRDALIAIEMLADKAREIVEVGRFLDGRGWTPATSGNFSSRLNADYVSVTASGKHKGCLEEADILVVDMNGQSRDPSKKPSAETLLHTTIYRCLPEVGAVLHIHSVQDVLISQTTRGQKALFFKDYEMLKAFHGIDSHDATLRVPVFSNTQDMRALSAEVEIDLEGDPRSLGFLIAGHGLYAWGRTMPDARRHVEAFVFLFSCELEKRRIGL